jgi:hypothetical protein
VSGGLAGLFAALLIRPVIGPALRGHAAAIGGVKPAVVDKPVPVDKSDRVNKSALVKMIAAYGLFGFGYVITATFLVAIVRQSPAIRPLEPWIWMLFGLAAVPSVPLWHSLGDRIGLARAYAVACIVEAIGVAASVEWVTVFGICVSAVLLGGTFTGQTALGLMSSRALAGRHPHRVISLMTVSFSIGQMIGPSVAVFSASGRAACNRRPSSPRQRSCSPPRSRHGRPETWRGVDPLPHFPSTSRTGVSGVSPPRRRANVSAPLSSQRPATARAA